MIAANSVVVCVITRMSEIEEVVVSSQQFIKSYVDRRSCWDGLEIGKQFKYDLTTCYASLIFDCGTLTFNVQISTGKNDKGLKLYDPGYLNTAPVRSTICYIDGDEGILRYRGYPIEELAEKSSYTEVAYLISEYL